MSHGPIAVYTDTIASGASTSAGINIARAWKTVWLQVGTMSTGVNLNVHGKATSSGDYYPVYHPAINSSTVTTNSFVVAASVGTLGGMVAMPSGFQYMRFVGTGVVSGGVTFKAICSD